MCQSACGICVLFIILSSVTMMMMITQQIATNSYSRVRFENLVVPPQDMSYGTRIFFIAFSFTSQMNRLQPTLLHLIFFCRISIFCFLSVTVSRNLHCILNLLTTLSHGEMKKCYLESMSRGISYMK